LLGHYLILNITLWLIGNSLLQNIIVSLRKVIVRCGKSNSYVTKHNSYTS